MTDNVMMQAQMDELKRQMHESINTIRALHFELHKALSTIDDTGLDPEDQKTLQEVKAKIGAFANATGREAKRIVLN